MNAKSQLARTANCRRKRIYEDRVHATIAKRQHKNRPENYPENTELITTKSKHDTYAYFRGNRIVAGGRLVEPGQIEDIRNHPPRRAGSRWSLGDYRRINHKRFTANEL